VIARLKKLNPFRKVTISHARSRLFYNASDQTRHHMLEALRKRYESSVLLLQAQAHELQVARLLALRAEMQEDGDAQQD
jgi:hypothetical protein